MSERNLDRLISDSVSAVLETMFFSSPLGPAEPETGPAVLEARLAFRGSPSGQLGLRISMPSARLLAAGFLGEDEDALTGAQPGQVVCEMANMMCGSLLSKLESSERFDLATPELLPAAGEADFDSLTVPLVCKTFQLENGILTIDLYLDAPA